MLQDVGAQLVGFHCFIVLAADDHGVDPHGLVVGIVLNRDLALAVRAKIGELAILAHFGQTRSQLVRQRNGCRHQLGCFVGGIAEHHALIARAAGIDAHRDIRRLRIDRRDDRTGVRVESVLRVGVADLRDRVAHDLLEVNVSLGRDLAGNHHQPGAGECFAGHAAHGVLRQAGIKNGIGNLVGNLVRMAFGNGFRRKQETIACGQYCSFRGAAAHCEIALF